MDTVRDPSASYAEPHVFAPGPPERDAAAERQARRRLSTATNGLLREVISVPSDLNQIPSRKNSCCGRQWELGDTPARISRQFCPISHAGDQRASLPSWTEAIPIITVEAEISTPKSIASCAGVPMSSPLNASTSYPSGLTSLITFSQSGMRLTGYNALEPKNSGMVIACPMPVR